MVLKTKLENQKRVSNKIEIQQLPNAILLNSKFGIGDFDDGLIYIGTRFCFNHDKPDCKNCPLKDLCLGKNKKSELIKNYRT